MNENRLKSYFAFTKSERIAIITIVSMIVIILVIKYLIVTNPPKRDYIKHDLDSIVARREFVMDSIRRADSLAKETAKANKIPRYARNDKTRHAETAETKRTPTTRTDKACLVPTSNACVAIDINTADTTLLKQLPGIGGAFAKWIVDYREKLGGYCETQQLLEVYRMDSTRYEGIKDYVKIDSLFTPNKLKINSDAFKVLLKHPYLEYNDVKKIVNHREQKGMIISWEQLKQVVGDGVNPKLRYYVDYQ